ncbi:NAD(P)H-dependent oxidoreductase [Actinopolyspora mortivallis]|uniref:FMN reductase n=1 Tax=Actinopolyspora mortivallis TaxID=33906 RepID=A0A2T0GW62_ACTMO|nr:NAD(P)H-dependent oxidoreductase [Actinopolyspora mortivallis]PRW63342.1 FMN reductase [Actinopolyspora mortivallis]
MSVRLLTLTGSLRPGSYNQQLAEAATELAPEDILTESYENLADIPYYNEAIDEQDLIPENAHALRAAATRSDAIMFFTPEYNGTMPATLKNAIDWLSRPFGASALSGKPAAVVSATFGEHGGIWAQEEVRKALGVAGAVVSDEVGLAVGRSMIRFAQCPPVEDAEIRDALLTLMLSTLKSSASLEGAH